MRRDLIDDARSRSGMLFTSLPGWKRPAAITAPPDVDLAARIESLLGELTRDQPHLLPVVELKYFLGLADDECADALDIDFRTVQRRWQDARWWLYQRVDGVQCQNPGWKTW